GVADNVFPQTGTVTVLLNGADWGGGHAAPPPGRFGLHPDAHRQLRIESFPALLTASQYQTRGSVSVAFTQLQVNAMQEWPVQTEAGPSSQSVATSTPGALWKVRYAQDFEFEAGGDPMVDVLAISLLT